MESCGYGLTETQRQLNECSRCLRIILELLNANNNGNLKDNDEIYFKRTDWITVKEKVRQYEMKIESIARAAMLLQSVRKRTGRLVKRDIKKIIGDLEERGHTTIPTVKESKVKVDRQKHDTKKNEGKLHSSKIISKPARKADTKRLTSGKQKEEIDEKSKEVKKWPRSSSQTQETSVNKTNVSTNERKYPDTQEKKKFETERSTVSHGQNKSSGDKDNYGQGKNTSTRGRSTSVRGRSANTKQNKTSTMGKSAGAQGKATSTRGRNASTQGKSTNVGKKNPNVQGKDAKGRERSASAQRKSDSTRGKSVNTQGKSTGTRGRSASAQGKSTDVREKSPNVPANVAKGRESSASAQGKGASTRSTDVREKSPNVPANVAKGRESNASTQGKGASTRGRSVGTHGKSARGGEGNESASDRRGRSISAQGRSIRGKNAGGIEGKSINNRGRSAVAQGKSASSEDRNDSTQGNSSSDGRRASAQGKSTSASGGNSGTQGKSTSSGEGNAVSQGESRNDRTRSSSTQGRKGTNATGQSTSLRQKNVSSSEKHKDSKRKEGGSSFRDKNATPKGRSLTARSGSTGAKEKNVAATEKNIRTRAKSADPKGSPLPAGHGTGARMKTGSAVQTPLKVQLQKKQNDKVKGTKGNISEHKEQKATKGQTVTPRKENVVRPTGMKSTEKKDNSPTPVRNTLASEQKHERQGAAQPNTPQVHKPKTTPKTRSYEKEGGIKNVQPQPKTNNNKPGTDKPPNKVAKTVKQGNAAQNKKNKTGKQYNSTKRIIVKNGIIEVKDNHDKKITPESPEQQSVIKRATKDLPNTKSESNVGEEKTGGKSTGKRISQSHEKQVNTGHTAEPQRKPSGGNDHTTRPTIRSSYLMKQVTSKNGKNDAKSEASTNVLKKSSTEEILSHSVSETDHLQRQKELERLHQKSSMKDDETFGNDNFATNVKAISSNRSRVVDEIFKVACEAANVSKNEIGADIKNENEEQTLTGFTPDQTRILVAKLVKNKRKLFLRITSTIFSQKGLLNDKGEIDKEIIDEVQSIIRNLDGDSFEEDVKNMMLDISKNILEKHPKFVNKLVRRIVQEMFKHMTVEMQSELMSAEGRMNTRMIVTVMHAFHRFMATGGPKAVMKSISKSFPILIFRLSANYGKKYKGIIRRMARRRKMAEMYDDYTSVVTNTEVSTSRVESPTTLTGTSLPNDGDELEMAYF